MGESTSRITKMSSRIDYTVRNYGITGNPQAPYDGSVNSYQTVPITSDSFAGSLNPWYKSQIRNGADATTGAFGTHTRISIVPCLVQAGYVIPNTAHPNLMDQRNTVLSGVLDHAQPNSQTAPPSIVIAVSNHAIRNFINAATEARQALLSGQDFGEARETLHGIISPMSSLRKYTLGFFPSLKKRLRGVKSIPSAKRVLADSYLEWTFGWKPLAQDVATAIVAHQNADKHYETVPVYGAGHDSFDNGSSVWRPLTNAAIDLLGSYKDTGIYYVRFKGAIRTGAVNGVIATDQLYGLQLPYFIPTVWELLPYSWIADYFLNVGDYLQARAFRFADLTFCCKTVRTTLSRQYGISKNVWPLPAGASWRFNSVSGGNSLIERVEWSRLLVHAQDLVPQLRFSFPLREKPWKNMGALLLQRAESVLPILRGLSASRKIASKI